MPRSLMGKHDLALKRQGLAIEGHRIDLVRQNIGQKRVAAIRHRRRCLCAENQLHPHADHGLPAVKGRNASR